MKQRIYKVVRWENGKLFSAFAEGKFRIEYKLNKWIIPEIGKIFCFIDLSDAEIFADYDVRFQIYKGIGINPKPSPFISGVVSGYSDFWKIDLEEFRRIYVLSLSSHGSYIADSIKLEKVK